MTRPGDRPPHARVIPRRKMTIEEQSLEEGHELRDMRLRQVIRYLALLTVAVTVLVGLVTAFEASLTGGIGQLRPVIDEPPRVTPPPEPRLETANGQVLDAQRAKEDQLQNNYTWIDQAAGTVSLPIDRAIELTIEEGLPVSSEGSAEEPPGVTMPQGSSSGRTLERIP